MSSQQLELYFSCRNLPTDAFSGVRIAVFIISDTCPNLLEIGQTETVVRNISPVFSRSCSISYDFEHSQKLRFTIYRIDGDSEKIIDVIAQLECILGEVMAHGGSIDLALFPTGGPLDSILNVRAKATVLSKQAIRLQFCGHRLHAPSDEYPLNAYFIMMLSPESGQKLMLYRSETSGDKSPIWKSFKVLTLHFLSSSKNCTVDINVYNYHANAQDQLIGRCTTSLDHLLRGVGAINTYKLVQSDHRKSDNGSIELVEIEQLDSRSFIDFIKTGTQIHFTVAVDFTASNGNPLDPSSLHYIHPHRYNPYMFALASVSNVIEKYNRHGKIAALGFGAQTPPDFQLSNLFFLNGSHHDPHVIGVSGVLSAYRSAIMAVRPYAPTDFSEVIYHVYKFGAASHHLNATDHYFVLLIVTDGCVTNPRKTLDAIVECSYLPMSIVIVGLGQRDFQPMNELMSPILKSSNGRPLRREIVTFIQFDASLSEKQLAEQVLKNIPRQFMTYVLVNEKTISSG